MSVLVVDTDVISFAFKGDTRFGPYAHVVKDCALIMSFMTTAELRLWGEIKNWGEARKDKLLEFASQHFAVYPATHDLCQIWAELKADSRRKGYSLDTADAWIAATAIILDAPLVTHNSKDFGFLSGLEVVSFSPQ